VLDELGSGADGLTVGQRVITIGVTGTWQEYVVADAGRVLAVPAGMGFSTGRPDSRQSAPRRGLDR
jgi:NADPH:quinone reductase-like Zn-dependent oxidoreductase